MEQTLKNPEQNTELIIAGAGRRAYLQPCMLSGQVSPLSTFTRTASPGKGKGN